MSTDIHFGGGGLQQDQQTPQQVSFHFWSCQLTEASPRYQWEPESAALSAAGKGDRPKRQTGRQNVQNGDAKGANDNGAEKANEAESNSDEKTENGEKNGHNEEDANGGLAENGEAAADADFMQHVLKVNACILGPKAAGVHLIALRTRCYRQAEPDACPIVCIDPDSQRTVNLGYEFVLDSQNEVTFELTEGAGPVWLTGLHQVRVHDPEGEGEGDDAEIEDADSIDEEGDVDESMDLNEEDDEEEEEEEEDEEDEDEEEARPVAKRLARASKADQQRPVASPKKRQPTAAAAKRGGGRASKKT